MNTDTDEDDAREREWQAQERAFRQELRGDGAAPGDARVLRYRAVVRALREPPPVDLPAHFARDLARAIGSGTPARAPESRFELGLALAAIAMFGLCLALVWNGDSPSAAALTTTIGALDTPWPIALLACIALSAVAQRRPARLR